MSEQTVVEMGRLEVYRPDASPPGLGPVHEREMVAYRPPPPRIDPVPAPQSFDPPLPPIADLKAAAERMKAERDRRRMSEYLEIVARLARGETLPAEVVIAACDAAGKSTDDLAADMASWRERETLRAFVATADAERLREQDAQADVDAARVKAADCRRAALAAQVALQSAEQAEADAELALTAIRKRLAEIDAARRSLVERPELAQFSDVGAVDRGEAVKQLRLRLFEAAQASEACRERRDQAHAHLTAFRNQTADLQHKIAVAERTGRSGAATMIREQLGRLQESIPAAEDALAAAERDFADARKLAADAEKDLAAATAAMMKGAGP